jgi:hypothetical protein
VIAFAIALKLPNPARFSDALPTKLLAQIGKVFAGRSSRLGPGGYVLSATVASVIRHKRWATLEAAPAGLQAGVLLGPAAPYFRHHSSRTLSR